MIKICSQIWNPLTIIIRTSLESQLETDIILAEPHIIQLYEDYFLSPRETLYAI